MSSSVFCSKCGKSEKQRNEFTNKNGNTICKECWLDDDDDDKEDRK
ncbi:MAG TPA: hypothetical protein VJ697_04645 [Nitrososphaeraceae archaeon]|nr:hypothetical protein [Nitrososphaeraceae archaeon]